MRLLALLAVCFLVSPLSPISTAVAQENDYLIVPGQRVGRWELGKALEAYGLGQPSGKWEGTAQGRAYYDGYAYRSTASHPYLQLYACKNDSLVFAVLVVRRFDAAPHPDPEELKYKTAEGVRVGMDEGEVLRILGQPDRSGQFQERHGQFEVLVKQLEYLSRGLFVRLNRTDLKVFALGAMREGGFRTCQQAVLGTPSAAQPTPAPAQAGVPVTVTLPVPVPANLRLIPPSADTPPGRAAFAGAWVGKWDNILDTALVVTEITSIGASAVYSWGVAQQWRITSPGWANVRGRFAGSDELHVQMPSVLVVYRMRSDGRLDGEYRGGQGSVHAIMTKVFPR